MGLSNHRREDHVRYHNDMPAHVGQDGVELVRKTVGSVLDYLASYDVGTITLYIGYTMTEIRSTKKYT